MSEAMEARRSTGERRDSATISARFAAFCILSAFALLLSGAIFYLSFRRNLPPLLARLNLTPPFQTFSPENTFLIGSLPDLLHVAAFTLLTCAFFRPGVRACVVAGLIWAGVDCVWELSCAHDQLWLRAVANTAGVRSIPRCTYDGVDMLAAFAGVAAASLIAKVAYWKARENSL
jgi:hypothetical protein